MITALSPPNDNVLIVPSRNVLLTGSAWRGGFRNISHDATGPRPVGRIEEGKEGRDHATSGGRGDRPDGAACSPAVEAVESQRRQGHRACAARPAIESQGGGKGPANGAGDPGPEGLCGLRADSGGGISGQEERHSCGARDRADLDDRRQAMEGPEAAGGEDPPLAGTPVESGRVGAMGHQRARLAGRPRAKAVPDQHDRRCHQPPPCAICSARLDFGKYAFAVELPGKVWTPAQLLYRQGEPVSNHTEDPTRSQRTAPRGSRTAAAHADWPGVGGVGDRLDWRALVTGQGPRGAQLRNSARSFG